MLNATSLYDGQVEHLQLDHGKGNVLDAALTHALTAHLGSLHRPQLKLVVLTGRPHFSFGASVEEHLPDQVHAMLTGFHALFRQLEGLGVPTCAVVSGACLGGGAELALWCGRVFVEPRARMGLPEVTLGVFPPLAAAGLRWRTGGNAATELICTGRTVGSDEAVRLGLADALVEDGEAAWRAWFEEHLLPRSGPAVRFAWRAARGPMRRTLTEELPELERLYLEDLMALNDPVEGLTAFLERRSPTWRHA